MPKISIIVPCYNTQLYINECIDSILNQTFKEFELILIDDGSNDKTLEILKEYKLKDKRVVLLSQENQGAAKSILNGIYQAKGEFIGFVDSDDWINNNMFEVLYNSIINNDVDLVQSGVLIDGKDIDLTLTSDKEYIISNISENLIKPFFEIKASLYPLTNARWNKLYKKEILYKIIEEIQTDIFIGEDMLFNLNYLEKCDKVIVLKGENNYNYRTNISSITKKHSLKKQSEYLKLCKRLIIYAEKLGYQSIAIDFFEKDVICSLILDTLLSNFTIEEKTINIDYLYLLLNDKKYIDIYMKERPFSAKVVLYLIKLKLTKLCIILVNILKR